MFLRRLYKNSYNHSIYSSLLKSFGNSEGFFKCKYNVVVERIFPNLFKYYGNVSFFSMDSISNPEISDEINSPEFTSEQDVEDEKFSIKQILYCDKDDKILQLLSQRTTCNEILETFDENQDQFQVNHMVQVVILLWNALKSRPIEANLNLNDLTLFNKFLHHLQSFINEMNPDELTCSLLYLTKIEVDSSHPTIRDIIIKTRFLLENDDEIPLSALSSFTVAINANNDIHTILACKEVMPKAIKHLELCKSSNDLRLITICLHNLVLMVNKTILNLYKSKIDELTKAGEINKSTIKFILKSLNFLNFPHWAQDNSFLIRELLLLLEDSMESLSPNELEIVFRAYQNQMEPATLGPKLLKAAENLHKQCPSIEIFPYIVQLSQTEKKVELTNIAKKNYFNNVETPEEIVAMFKALRTLKTADLEICNKLWNKVLNLIINNPQERQSHKLLKHCHRYMHFNNNLGGTYRHKQFEKFICNILIEELSEGLSHFIPSKFARLSCFILAYGHTDDCNYKFPDFVVEKIEDMATQFNIIDCLFLSRGLQIALELRFKKFLPPTLASQLLRIENVLNTCSERQLQNSLTCAQLNFVIRSLYNRKSSRKSPIFLKAVSLYSTYKGNLNSRSIRDITLNLSSTNYLIPDMLENIFKYLVNNRNYILGETVEKILNCSYNLGYTPKSEDALHWSAEIIKRDFNFMTGLSIIQSCLALCYYKAIPESLVNKVFCIDFIQRLEDEIQSCYSKATYPEKVLNQVMQLNRAVCLDYPESRVPWFQQNYIEAQMSKKPILKSRIHTEVKNLLISIIKNESLLKCNHITPYGYVIDFVIHFDKNKQLIPHPSETTLLDKITKVAILPLNIDSFCENNSSTIRGHELLKMRHLEILGYKVIHLNINEWNAMYMNMCGAKEKYLKALLQIE